MPPTDSAEDTSLRDALNKAGDENDAAQGDAEDQGDEANEDVEKPKTDKSKTATGDKAKTESEDEDEDDDEDTLAAQKEQENAIKFYRQITNPETSEAVLQSIAKRAGYELKNLNQEQRDAVVDEVEAVLRETLGDEYALLPNGLSKALNKIINGKLKIANAEIESLKQRVNGSEEHQRRIAVDEALAWAADEYPEFEAKNKKILREMKAFPPSPEMNAREYIKKICKLADIAPKSSVNNARANRASNNKDGVMPSDGVRKERSTKVANSLAEAAAMAYDEQFPD